MTVIGFVAVCWWRRSDNKASKQTQQKQEQLLTDQFTPLKNCQEALAIEAAHRAAESIIDKPPGPWTAGVRQLITGATNQALDANLSPLSPDDLAQRTDEAGAGWASLVSAGRQSIQDEVSRFATSTGKAALEDRLKHFVDRGFMTADTRDQTVARAPE